MQVQKSFLLLIIAAIGCSGKTYTNKNTENTGSILTKETLRADFIAQCTDDDGDDDNDNPAESQSQAGKLFDNCQRSNDVAACQQMFAMLLHKKTTEQKELRDIIASQQKTIASQQQTIADQQQATKSIIATVNTYNEIERRRLERIEQRRIARLNQAIHKKG
jgi:hypothetical protein